MSKATFLAAARAAHVEGLEKEQIMLCQLWEDGEVTYQKAGPLLHQRSLHCIEPGKANSVPITDMPVQMYSHGCAFIRTSDEAREIAKELDNE